MEMTARELQSRGGKARTAKVPKEIRMEISKKGGNTTKQRYGLEHYRELKRLSDEAKKAKKSPVDK